MRACFTFQQVISTSHIFILGMINRTSRNMMFWLRQILQKKSFGILYIYLALWILVSWKSLNSGMTLYNSNFHHSNFFLIQTKFFREFFLVQNNSQKRIHQTYQKIVLFKKKSMTKKELPLNKKVGENILGEEDLENILKDSFWFSLREQIHSTIPIIYNIYIKMSNKM